MKSEIIYIGNYIYEGSQCGIVISINGLSSCLSAGTHGYCNCNLLVIEDDR